MNDEIVYLVHILDDKVKVVLGMKTSQMKHVAFIPSIQSHLTQFNPNTIKDFSLCLLYGAKEI